jgi:hypothetical protein
MKYEKIITATPNGTIIEHVVFENKSRLIKSKKPANGNRNTKKQN